MHRRIPRPPLLFSLAVLALAKTAFGQTPDFGDHEYRIAVRLDPERHEVRGSVTIRYRNRSENPIEDLVFHLYPNAFEHDETVFMRESGDALRGVPSDARGRIELQSLRIDEVEALERASDELLPKDRTQLRVPLEAPLRPGERLTIEIDFVTHLPALFARSGYVDRFHLVAQFFPKLAKLSRMGEWRSFPYHGLGEFYADFASYELAVEAPPDLVVAANGVRGPVEFDGPWPVHRFRAEDVHDVAFAAWDRFETRSERCHGVRVHLFFPPGGDEVAARSLALACRAFDELGRLLGPYPYKDLSIVFPPRGAEGGAGMEYPGLVISAAGSHHPSGLRFFGPDATTAHELAHQWFQGVVATNEVLHPMLDEGLATFFGNELMAIVHGRDRSALERPPLDIAEFTRALLPEKAFPPSLPVYAFPGEYELYGSLYGHFPLALETVARLEGRDRLMKALGHYARTHRFKHPKPEDLLASFAKVYGEAYVREVLEPALFRGHAVRFTLDVQKTEDAFHYVAKRAGRLPLPTVVQITHVDGTVERIPFPAEAETVELSRPREVVARVEIDPDRQILVDRERNDQAHLPRPGRSRGLLVAALRALFAWCFG